MRSLLLEARVARAGDRSLDALAHHLHLVEEERGQAVAAVGPAVALVAGIEKATTDGAAPSFTEPWTGAAPHPARGVGLAEERARSVETVIQHGRFEAIARRTK